MDSIKEKLLELSLDKLAAEFRTLDLTFHRMENGRESDVTSYWPGNADEDVMICVFNGKEIEEPFHRQDFFFLNYAYRGSYDALSAKRNRLITIHEGECYIGQPFSGYALRGDNQSERVIIGVLIRRETFFREYLPTLVSDSSMFHFFLAPETNRFSEEFIHLSFERSSPVRTLLEMMVTEYADRREDTQGILKPLALALFMNIARRYRMERQGTRGATLSERIIQYMSDHTDASTLKDIAAHFSYHPNYISTVLRRETGRTFSEILLEKRMERAAILLKGTSLPVEKIAPILGYGNSSNFYKAFREYFHLSPREYAELGNGIKSSPPDKNKKSP